MMQPEAIIEVRFKTTDEGGRKGTIKGQFYGCPLFIDGEGFDCRIFLDGRTLDLGKTYVLPVKFLNPDIVLAKLKPGKIITLWEGKDIAIGKVVRLA